MPVRRSHFARLEALDRILAASSRSAQDVGARLVRFGVLFVSLTVLAGCSATGNSGGGSAAADAALAVDPIYLDPGQTVAQLAWVPSEGPVENYMVFESRNGSGFAFSTIAVTPSVDIIGAAGDNVRITVVAVSPNGAMSDNSPASPPVIFQAAAEAVVAQNAPQGLAAPVAVATPETELAENEPDASETDLAANDTPEEPDTDASAVEDEAPALTLLVHSLRALLLGGDARLPEAGLSTDARDWLQARVDAEIAAGVSLAGTGRANDDGLRELVWQDPAGQLFVSDGEEFLDAPDLPATLTEGLRLNATERFVGLADFDGDGLGDWLVEDTVTGDVWIMNDADDEAQPPAHALADAALAGHGDFDGDGIAELLWVDADRGLSLSSASLIAPRLAEGSGQPAGTTLLAIADLDGNGRDDLLTRADDGTLVLGFARDTPAGASIAIDWQVGATLPSSALDLIATVDVDEDGAAEIAWLSDGDLEIWTAEGGLSERLRL
ncbi:MAG: FG-GAP repeat domain-containing protein [Myxococcota bacterium]